MQIIGSITTNPPRVIGTRTDPELGEARVTNGQFVFPLPQGVALNIDENSYFLPQDGGDIASLAMAEFLIRYPMYDHAVYNFFLEGADIALLDTSAGAPAPLTANVVPTPPSWAVYEMGVNGPRCQVGAAGAGSIPGSISILPRNDNRATPTYGCLMSDTIDITAMTGVGGTDEAMVWWHISTVDVSEDLLNASGGAASDNSPALRRINEVDQEPADLFVYVSVDDGVTWYLCPFMQPTDLVVAGTDLRVAFVNVGTSKIYLNGFAVLFPNTP